MEDVGTVDYYKCSRCGFVLSRTHSEMDSDSWTRLNHLFHHFHENSGFEKGINQPPYAEQAMSLYLLGRNHIIDLNSIIDYAAGYGYLSKILSRYYGVDLPIYDPYIRSLDSERYIPTSELGIYKTVINSAMFEHILKREDLDKVNNIVDPGGCLVLHTVVCDNIPKDPSWFYLQVPVHTAFHTNRSMEILMEQWCYKSSIYSPSSKSWVLFRESIKNIKPAVERINDELRTKWFHCKMGFVDYWKGF